MTLTRSGFASPVSTADDFRGLAAVLVARALREAGTRVLEPVSRVELDVPPATVGPVLAMLAEARARVEEVCPEGGRLEAVVHTAGLAELHRRLPVLTAGEGQLLSRPAGYRPVTGPPPVNPAAG